jgi:hypothetical protein
MKRSQCLSRIRRETSEVTFTSPLLVVLSRTCTQVSDRLLRSTYNPLYMPLTYISVDRAVTDLYVILEEVALY